MDKVDDYNLPFRAAAMISHMQVPKQSGIHSKGWMHQRGACARACARGMREDDARTVELNELNCL